MLPALLGQEQQDHEFLYWETPSGGYWQAVRCGMWKAVRTRWGAPLELYHLGRDAGEQNDVAGRHPDLVKKLGAFMRTSHVESKDWPTPNISPNQ